MTDDGSVALAQAFGAARDLDAPLAERLAAYAAELQQHAPDYSAAVDRLVARLKAVSAGNQAPNVGDVMPEFLLPDERGKLISLSDLLSGGPLVIAFHRGHWCPFCRLNARALAEMHEMVITRGGQIVAISPERGQYTVQHRAQAGATYLMLSDIENAYALSLNLGIWMDDDVRTHLLGFGRDLDIYLGAAGWILPIPATFVVAKDGKVIARYVDPDHRHRMGLDAILAALETAS